MQSSGVTPGWAAGANAPSYPVEARISSCPWLTL